MRLTRESPLCTSDQLRPSTSEKSSPKLSRSLSSEEELEEKVLKPVPAQEAPGA